MASPTTRCVSGPTLAYARYVETIEFVAVGIAAAILQGAPSVTLDVDIVHEWTPENVEKLLGVLDQIHAVARYDERKRRFAMSSLRAAVSRPVDHRLRRWARWRCCPPSSV
jgi:hypothetical protein